MKRRVSIFLKKRTAINPCLGAIKAEKTATANKIVRIVTPILSKRLWYLGKFYDFCQINYTEDNGTLKAKTLRYADEWKPYA